VPADAAVVLGAAVWGEELSPVFTERVNHSLNLYRSGKVRKIIFTGGQGNRNELTESAAARLYALEHGIPEDIILIEEKSHDTHENLFYAKEVADDNQLKTVLIVSDPLHMKRAMIMGRRSWIESLSVSNGDHQVSKHPESNRYAGTGDLPLHQIFDKAFFLRKNN
jgi:uncharacterized SAM-binding protein YcdF (DUF218 family)